jgi:hypothetical protein
MDQYDRADFDLGIKQFMLEAKVKAVSGPGSCCRAIIPSIPGVLGALSGACTLRAVCKRD